MRKSADRLFLVLALFVFACLLLSGGSRLIASPEDGRPVPPAPPSVIKASLSCPPTEREADVTTKPREEKRIASLVPVVSGSETTIAAPPMTDANGNVLGQKSYMRAVYQSFALGDGFA